MRGRRKLPRLGDAVRRHSPGSLLLAALLLCTLICSGCHRYRQVLLPAILSPQAMADRVLPGAAPDITLPSAARDPTTNQVTPEETLPAPRVVETPVTVPDVNASAESPFTLADAIMFGLRNTPRLRVVQEQVAAARAGQDIAFAPFLPQVEFGYRFLALTTRALPAGSFVAGTLEGGEYAFSLPEIGMHWTLCDFGRTSGRYGQAVTRAEIADLHLARAQQTVAYDIAGAYFQLLRARAVLRIRDQALLQSEAILKDTEARRKAGTADRNAVLRAEVEVSESRESVVAARREVFDAEARLNVVMGRSVSLPIQVVDVKAEPPFARTLEDSLQQAIHQRRELDVARRVVAEALYGERAARAEFLPKLFVRASVLRVDSPGPLSTTVEAAGIHLEMPIYSGGKHRGELRKSEALERSAIANSQVILDNIALEVNLAYRAIAANRERIRLGVTAVAQARENLRLTVVKYNNGDATPTDIVDAQTALTRASMRYSSALYDYLAGLAQLEYATGGDQSMLLQQVQK